VPHKEGRLSSPCSQHVVSVNTTTSFTKPEIQNPISKQLQYVAATTCSLGALSPVTVQNKPSPGADVRDTRQQNGTQECSSLLGGPALSTWPHPGVHMHSTRLLHVVITLFARKDACTSHMST
jgi:hypothetical protein